MASALDTTRNCTSIIGSLRAGGYDTVIRYYSGSSSWKRLGQPEANALSKGGIRLGVVYQDRQDRTEDFSKARGHAAGANAFSYAQNVIFQPARSAIYFSVDFDPTEEIVVNQVAPFFDGVRAAIADGSGGDPIYRIGVYESGRTCRILKEKDLVELTWLAQSKGFAEYETFLKSGMWNLSQAMPIKLAGVDCDPDDINVANPDFGGFALEPDHFGAALPREGSELFLVNASTGLRLRGGPGTDFETHKVLAPGSQVRILLTQGEWSQVDTTGDDQADGFVYSAYLKPVAV